MSLIRAEELVGGSRTEYGVPIYWQIESEGTRVPNPVIVGSVPEGWTETVRYEGELPDDDLVGIEGTRSGMGMSFHPGALREGEILRGTYDKVSIDRFYTDARGECAAMKRGAFIAGLLAPLVTAAALLFMSRLHQSQPDSWGARQVRRGWIWVVALSAGSFWTLMLFAVGNYEAHVGEIVIYSVLAAIPVALLGMVVLPVAAGVGWLGRRIVPTSWRPSAAIGAAISCGALFWAIVGDLDLRWLPLSFALALALMAMTPASQLRLDVPTGAPARVAAILALSGCCLASAFGAVALLSNSPSEPEWDLADYEPADSLDIVASAGSRVLLDERRSGTGEISFEASPGYELSIACDGVSVQVSGGLGRGSVSYGARAAVPCSAGEIDGPLGGRVRSGEEVFLKVVAPPDVEWHIVATTRD